MSGDISMRAYGSCDYCVSLSSKNWDSDLDLGLKIRIRDQNQKLCVSLAVPDPTDCRSTGWQLISEIKYASTVTSICVLVTF